MLMQIMYLSSETIRILFYGAAFSLLITFAHSLLGSYNLSVDRCDLRGKAGCKVLEVQKEL